MENKKEKSVVVLGTGNNVLASSITLATLSTQSTFFSPVQKKLTLSEKREQTKRQVETRLRQGFNRAEIDEYLLILAKKSNLSRAKRDGLVYRINILVRKGVLTQEELDLLKPKILKSWKK